MPCNQTLRVTLKFNVKHHYLLGKPFPESSFFTVGASAAGNVILRLSFIRVSPAPVVAAENLFDVGPSESEGRYYSLYKIYIMDDVALSKSFQVIVSK